jgi:hypothetical protein
VIAAQIKIINGVKITKTIERPSIANKLAEIMLYSESRLKNKK